MLYKLEEARRSKDSRLTPIICYIDYRNIKTHEKAGSERAKEVLESMLENGYRGPAITIFRKGGDVEVGQNETINQSDGTYGIADGHHRLDAMYTFDKAGLLKSRIIPVQVIPARDSDVIRIGTLVEEEQPLTISDVESCFESEDKVVQVCTSHFQVHLGDGAWVRLREGQPDLVIEKNELLNLGYRSWKTSIWAPRLLRRSARSS